MNKSVVFALLLIGLVVFCTAGVKLVNAEPMTIIVYGDSSSIQSAVDRASSGNIVLVKSGTYRQNVTIDKPISLISENPKTTMLSGLGDASNPFIAKVAIQINSDNVTVSGFTIKYDYFPSSYGIRGNGNNTQVTGNKIVGAANGIVLVGSNNVVMENIVANSGYGIEIIGSNNTIEENTINGAVGDGIAMRGSSNTARDNTLTGCSMGIEVKGEVTNIISNLITGGNEGLKLWFCSNSTVSGNRIERNGLWGICLGGSFGNVFYGNLIADARGSNGGYGVSIGGTTYTTRSENNVFFKNSFVNNIVNARVRHDSVNNTWDNGKTGNYWSDYKGDDENGDGLGDALYRIDADNSDRHPLMEPLSSPEVLDTIPPVFSVISPENKIYETTNVTLAFTMNENTLWMGYSLDRQENVTLYGNMTLSGLSNGPHNLTLYAQDEAGNTGFSEIITFTRAEPQPDPFPITLVVASSVASVAVIGAGLLVYFKKRKH